MGPNDDRCKMRKPRTIPRFGGWPWATPACLAEVQPALTAKAVKSAERQLGVRLPALYLALLRQQNGGYLRGSGAGRCCLNGIGPSFPSITLDRAWWRPAQENDEVWIPEGAEHLIPFDGDGHWDVCFDYRESGPEGEPSITLVECENESEKGIARSLAAYLDQLDDPLATSIRLYGEVELGPLVARVAKKLGQPRPAKSVAFEDGIPQWVIGLPGESEWIAFSPNRVPAGVKRKGKGFVHTKTMGLQLREDPDCLALVRVSDGSRRRCLRAISELGVRVVEPG